MLIGVPLETLAGETRVAVTPETVKKLKAQGHTIRVQSGAGIAASAIDAAHTIFCRRNIHRTPRINGRILGLSIGRGAPSVGAEIGRAHV